jgi:hypothetical protein
MGEENNKIIRYMLIAVLALLTYFAVYLLCNYALRWLGTYDWRFESATISPTYAFMPFLGFSLVFYGLYSWQQKFKEKKASLAVLFVFFILFSLVAFWLNLWFFYKPVVDSYFGRIKNAYANNPAQMPALSYGVCTSGCKVNSGFACPVIEEAGRTIVLCEVNFWSEFFRSAFFVFWVSGILAGITFFVYDMLAKLFAKQK